MTFWLEGKHFWVGARGRRKESEMSLRNFKREIIIEME